MQNVSIFFSFLHFSHFAKENDIRGILWPALSRDRAASRDGLMTTRVLAWEPPSEIIRKLENVNSQGLFPCWCGSGFTHLGSSLATKVFLYYCQVTSIFILLFQSTPWNCSSLPSIFLHVHRLAPVGGQLPARKRTLTRNQISLYLDLGLSRLRTSEK